MKNVNSHKQHLLDLAKELTNYAYQIEELGAELQEMKRVKELQAKALCFAMTECNMDFNEMLNAANIMEKEAISRDIDDVLPTPSEMQELAKQDEEQMTEDQMQYYYASSTNPAYNPSIDPKNC